MTDRLHGFLLVTATLVACSASGETIKAHGQGGSTETGGIGLGSGGSAQAGGSESSGGSSQEGGSDASAAGGSQSGGRDGGDAPADGSAGSGGLQATGGATASGGSQQTGGSQLTGGTLGSGGAPIDAGPTSKPLPLVIDAYFFMTGWMGNPPVPPGLTVTDCTATRPAAVLNPYAQARCHEIVYAPTAAGWAGIHWQYPVNNWGTYPGLPIQSGAKTVSFYAWGKAGGEVVKFAVGDKDKDGFNLSVDAALTKTPQAFSINLAGTTYTTVSQGFIFIVTGGVPPVDFFVDNIVWK